MAYVFDTNSIRVLRNYYPARFPTFWGRFDDVVDLGTVISVREVYNELQYQVSQQWLLDWLAEHKSMFVVPDAAETQFVAAIMAVPHFRVLVGEQQLLKGQPVADPFLIAAARVRGGTVVTEEAHKPNAAKIPNVCEHFGVPFTSVEGFLAANGWTF